MASNPNGETVDAIYDPTIAVSAPFIGGVQRVATILGHGLVRFIVEGARGDSVGALLTTPSPSAQAAMLPRREQERLLGSGTVRADRSAF